MQFSILIPSWNNLHFLRLCIESIRKNSTYQHQIIVHVNEGSDGTLEWIKNEGIDYTYSTTNIGVCLAMNSMRTKVKCDYICFINDDMYVLPEWDKYICEEIENLNGNKYFFFSSSTIQPKTMIFPGTGTISNYGDTIENFEEKRLLKEYKQYQIPDWTGASVPPNIVHRDIWDLVGGYSIEFTPGMGSDHDFTAKIMFVGIKIMKGLGKSLVYHFETKSTSRLKKKKIPQFLYKWGITNSTYKKIINVGKKWQGNESYFFTDIKKYIVKSALKSIIFAFKHRIGTQKKFWE